MKQMTREECERDPNAALDSAMLGPVAIVDESGVVRGVLSGPSNPPKRTLEEILAYSRETGMDRELTAEEAGLLRREVERLRARHHEASANPSEDPTEANHIEEIRLWLEREPGPYQHEVDDAREAAAWLLAVLDGRAVMLADERAKRISTEEECDHHEVQRGIERERADKAERKLRAYTNCESDAPCGGSDGPCPACDLRNEGYARSEDARIAAEERADQAERELAEARESVKAAGCDRAMFERSWRDGLVTIAERTQIAEKAEARVAVLESDISTLQFDQRTLLTQKANLEIRNTGLQALVDAATKFTFDNVAVIRIAGSASSWWVCPPNKPHEMIDTRDEAIALARDLGKKEPTR